MSPMAERLADAEIRRRRDRQEFADAFVAKAKPSATREPRLIHQLCGLELSPKCLGAARAVLAAGWLMPLSIVYARSRNRGFAKLLPTSSIARVRKRTCSDIICKQRRSSASHSFIWFRISRRSNCVIDGSPIRRQATVCQSFNSPIFLLKLSGSVMSLAPPLGKFEANADS